MTKSKRTSLKYSLEEIVQHTLISGPRVITQLGTRLQVEDAESIAFELQREHGMAIEAYDFPSTNGVWQSCRWDGIPYQHLATRQLIATLADRHGADYTTPEGFKQILGELTVDSFRHTAINRWGTTLGGLLTLNNSEPSSPVLSLIEEDRAFRQIRKKGLQAYDFPIAPRNVWVGKQDRRPTDQAREATLQWIRRLAAQRHVNFRRFTGFRRILPYMTSDLFTTMPIDYWGTTLLGMMPAYGNSHIDAILDAVRKRDDTFRYLPALEPYDFPCTPNRTWKDERGKPTPTARKATRLVLETHAHEKGVDCRTEDGLRAILQGLTAKVYAGTPANAWGTTFQGAINAYKNSVTAAVTDLIEHDPDFIGVRGVDVRPLSPRPRRIYLGEARSREVID